MAPDAQDTPSCAHWEAEAFVRSGPIASAVGGIATAIDTTTVEARETKLSLRRTEQQPQSSNKIVFVRKILRSLDYSPTLTASKFIMMMDKVDRLTGWT